MKQRILFKSVYIFIFLNALCSFSLCGNTYWSPPQILFVEEGGKKDPICSINSRGDALIGWVNMRDKAIEISEYDYLGNKIHSPRIAYPCSAQIVLLDVLIGNDKDIAILWLDKEFNTLKAAKYDRLLSVWSDTVTISKADLIETPVLKMDRASNAFVAWTQYNGYEYRVQTVYFSKTHQKWGPPVTLSPIGFNCHLQKFAFDSLGNAVAVWKSTLLNDQMPYGNNYGIQAVRFSVVDQSWSKFPFFFDVYSEFILTDPEIIFDEHDNFIIIWKKEHIASKNEILQFISYDTSKQRWGNKTDIPTNGALSNTKLVRMKDYIYACWQSANEGREVIQTIKLNYPAGPLEEIQTISSPLSKIEEYKIKSDVHGKIKVLFSGDDLIKIAELQDQWVDVAFFENQQGAHRLQLEGDYLGNSFAMWRKENCIFYTFGNYLSPPTHLNARVIQKRFPAKTVNIVQLTWVSSKSPSIKGYRIRRNKVLVAEVHSSQSQFIDKGIPRGELVYSITSVNQDDLESRPFEIVIRN